MSYYPEPDSLIRDKVKVVLDLSNYATKKELYHATGVDTSELAAKNDFNVPTSLHDLKTKVDDLDVGKLKTVPVDFPVKLRDVMDNEAVKNTKFIALIS